MVASRQREEKLRAELTAAQSLAVELEKTRAALGQELGRAQGRLGELESRSGEFENKLREEAGQRENWERRAIELEQARVALQGELRVWAEREGRLKSECARNSRARG